MSLRQNKEHIKPGTGKDTPKAICSAQDARPLYLFSKKKTKPRKPSRPQVTLGGHTTKGWEAVHDCLSHLTRVHITWRGGKPYLQKFNKLYPKSHQPERSSDVNIIVGIFPYIYTMLRGKKKKKTRLSSILHILRLQYKNIIHRFILQILYVFLIKPEFNKRNK